MERVGRYEIVRSLARGGMGEVLLARLSGPAGFARPVVVKRVREDLAQQAEARDMLLDEARITSRLVHPNIVQGIDLVETPGGFYLVMEFVDGTHLGRLLRVTAEANQKPDLVAVAWVISRIACALHFAHHAEDPETGAPLHVIHRDVTPSNILLSFTGDVKLSDFGVAKAETQQVKTQQGLLKGKVGYLSPEQCNLAPIDGRSDVFSLGVVLYEALSLRRLYREQDPLRAMARICEEQPPRPSARNSEVDATLDGIVHRALQKDPEDRFATAGAMQQALEGWMYGRGPSRTVTAGLPPRLDDRNISPDRTLVSWLDRRRQAIDPPPASEHESSDPDAVTKRDHRTDDVSATIRVPRTEVNVRDPSPPLPAVTNGMLQPAAALPRFSTPHVGRETELAAMRSHYENGGRALCIVGGKGMGKSRLCVEFCRRMRAEGARRPFRSEVYVDLAAASRLDAMCQRIADALAVQLLPADEATHVTQLGAALAGRGDVLLVLDDVDGAAHAEAIAAFRQSAPQIRLLLSARTPIRISGVSVFALKSLEDDDAAARSLFIAAARELRPDFVLLPEDDAVFARVIHHLHGHPFSISLVAGRLGEDENRSVALTHLAHELDAGTTMRSGDDVVRWALEKLSPTLARALSILSAFEGPALLSEVRECAPEVGASDLRQLVRRGLVRTENAASELGYVVHDVVHDALAVDFETHKLVREVTAARAEFATQSAERGNLREDARAYLDFTRARLLPLAERALIAQDPAVAARLALIALRLGISSTHATALLERIASVLHDDGLGARLEIALGNALFKRGRNEHARRVLRHATTIARKNLDAESSSEGHASAQSESARSTASAVLADALLESARVDTNFDLAHAKDSLDEALAIAMATPDALLEERIRTARAQVLSNLGLDDDAVADLKRARILAHGRGSQAREGRLALALAALCDRSGKTVDAATEARHARVHLEAAGDTRGAFEAGLLLGHVLAAERQGAEAKQTFAHALSLATKQGDIPGQIRAMGALAAAAALTEGGSAAHVYLAGIDALVPSAPKSIQATVEVYRAIVASASGQPVVDTVVNHPDVDAVAARLFSRVQAGTAT